MNLSDEDIRPRVLAVVVTHNGREWLAECLGSLASQVYSNLSVVVVDSGSNRSPASLVKKVLPDAEFVRLDRNVGFGAAANHGLEVSHKAPDAEFFLFMHDDVALDPETLSLLIATAVETEAGIVGGKGHDWSHPEVLLEVGMSADQFGYPFSGLEEGEIDQGQHDRQRETLFVTNACMLVARKLIERCGSWDGAYFAFGEDLDLCTRSRLAGFRVYVQPGAAFRHAAALANQERDSPAAKSIRFLTRRNRLRTITKNTATYRVPIVLMLYSILVIAEMAFLSAFRRFDELAAYPKSLISYFLSLPEVLGRRRAVQKRRTVPDRRIRRFMVRDVHRARVFFEKRFGEWGEETVDFGSKLADRFSPRALRKLLKDKLRKPVTIAYIAVAASVIYGLRHLLFGDPIGGGSIWPFPEQTSRFLGEYLSGWRDVRLGTESAPPPAFLFFWLSGLISLGNPLTAQRLTVLILVAVGLIGVWFLVSRRTSSGAAQVAALGVYGLAPLLRLTAGTADLGAFAIYAASPFLLGIFLRMLGPIPTEQGERPGTVLGSDAMVRDAARGALVTAGVVALGPSSLIAVILLAFILGMHSLASRPNRRESLRRLGWTLISAIAGLIVLLPWTIEALRPRGPILGPLTSREGGIFAPMWSGRDFQGSLLLSPFGGRLEGLAVAGILLGTLLVAGPSRRREARSLITAWMFFAVIAALVSAGLMPTPTASYASWMIVPLACVSLAAGLLVAGIREELPKHALGFRHVASAAVVLAMAASLVGSWFISLPKWDKPVASFAAGTSEAASSIASYFQSTAETTGEFRVLWLGERWLDPIRTGTRRIDEVPFLLTGPGGLSMLEAYEGPPAHGDRQLDAEVAALVGRRLHLSGHLLAPANIRFIVVDPRDDFYMAALRRQRDIALEQQQEGIAIFRNLQWLPRASLAPVTLVAELTGSTDRSSLLLVEWSGGRDIPQRSATSFRGSLPRTRHSQLILAENFNSGWNARVGDKKLEHARAFGWANRFELPPDASGDIRVSYSGRLIRLLWVLFQLMILTIVSFAAGSARHEIKGWLR